MARAIGSAINLDTYIQERKDRYVLGYHRILSAKQAQCEGVHHSLWITPEMLESQIRWMRCVGEIVSYSRIIDFTKSSDRPLFTLTFDDGWKDNNVHALPILRKYHVPALIFLATDAVETGALFWPQDIATKTQRVAAKGRSEQVVASLLECWPERAPGRHVKQATVTVLVEQWIEAIKLLDERERRQYIEQYFRRLNLSTTPLEGFIMSWEEAREMHAFGIDFGSHTHHHSILKGLPAELIENELKLSRSLIAENLQIEADSFCYPNGRYSGTEGAILSRCGYRFGFSLDSRSLRQCTDNFYIPRFLVSEGSAANAAYFKLGLLGAPVYRSKPHDPMKVRRKNHYS